MRALRTQVTTKSIFVLKLSNGKFVIGQSTNAPHRIAAINSGHNQFVGKKPHQVVSIIGIKPVSEERNLMSVVSKFCDQVGAENVITV